MSQSVYRRTVYLDNGAVNFTLAGQPEHNCAITRPYKQPSNLTDRVCFQFLSGKDFIGTGVVDINFCQTHPKGTIGSFGSGSEWELDNGWNWSFEAASGSGSSSS